MPSRPRGINDLSRPRPALTRKNAGTRGPRSLHVPVSRIRANTFPCHEFVQTRSRVSSPCICGHVWPRRDHSADRLRSPVHAACSEVWSEVTGFHRIDIFIKSKKYLYNSYTILILLLFLLYPIAPSPGNMRPTAGQHGGHPLTTKTDSFIL